jgi:hypothetical protein
MPQVTQWANVLIGKLQPSFDIQRRGSSQIPIRSSSTFGPQINRPAAGWSSTQHKQNTALKNMLNKMNQ